MLGPAKAKGHPSFVSTQTFYNLVHRDEEREMMPLCAAQGIAVIPWSPKARGYLAGSGMGGESKTLRAHRPVRILAIVYSVSL